jgi:hypothetical protein
VEAPVTGSVAEEEKVAKRRDQQLRAVGQGQLKKATLQYTLVIFKLASQENEMLLRRRDTS